ncbi:MAG: hypothetical protein RIQ90_586 [Bacteroidota bacterium]|jgi:hypothetical protein
MKKYALLSLWFLVVHFSFGQENTTVRNPRAFYKKGYDIRLLGPTPLLSVSMNYFVNQNVNLEAGIGLIGAFGGIEYYLGKKEKRNLTVPYAGLKVGYMTLPDIDPALGGSSDAWGKFATVYLPVGVQLMTMNGFHISLEGALFATFGYHRNAAPWGSLKIGKNF